MRLYLVMDETRFYQPDFVARFLERTNDEVVGAALVTRVPGKNDLSLYFVKNWHYLKIDEIAKLIFDRCIRALKDVIFKKTANGKFYSVRSVFKYFKIDFIEVKYDINNERYLDVIRKKKPDVIISSNSLLFKEELLKLPARCCLNRHSALMPSLTKCTQPISLVDHTKSMHRKYSQNALVI